MKQPMTEIEGKRDKGHGKKNSTDSIPSYGLVKEEKKKDCCCEEEPERLREPWSVNRLDCFQDN